MCESLWVTKITKVSFVLFNETRSLVNQSYRLFIIKYYKKILMTKIVGQKWDITTTYY